MKTRLFAVILADLVLLISPLSAGETYEILTDSAGRKLEAAILKYARDGVTVKRKSDGKEFVLTYDKLSGEDRVRLRDRAREDLRKKLLENRAKLPGTVPGESGPTTTPPVENATDRSVSPLKVEWIIQPVFDEADAHDYGGDSGMTGYSTFLVSGESGNKAADGGVHNATGRMWGMIDQDGKVLVDPRAGETIPDPGGFVQTATGKKEAARLAGKPIPELHSYLRGDSVNFAHKHGSILFAKDGKWGLKDITGKVLVEPSWESARYDASAGLVVFRKDNRWDLAKPDGTVLTTTGFEEIGGFRNGFAPVRKLGRFGFIDTSGTMVREPSFTAVYPEAKLLVEDDDYPAGCWWVSNGTKWGLLDARSGEARSGFQWENVGKFPDAYKFVNGTAWVMRGAKWGLVDASGKVIAEPEWDGAGPAVDSANSSTARSGNRGRVVPERVGSCGKVWKDGKAGALDLGTGKVLLPPEWEDWNAGMPRVFNDDPVALRNIQFGVGSSVCFFVKRDGKWGIAGQDGKLKIEPRWTTPGLFLGPDRLAFGESGGNDFGDAKQRYGISDFNGKTLVPAKWKEIRFNPDWLAQNRMGFLDGKWGIADRDGTVVMEPLEQANVFEFLKSDPKIRGVSGLRVKVNHFTERRLRIVDGDGIPPKDPIRANPPAAVAGYDDWETPMHKDYYVVSKDRKWGVVDAAGKVVIPFAYGGERDVGFESCPFGWGAAHGHWFDRSGGKIRDLEGCSAKPPTTMARASHVFSVEKDGKWGYAKIVRP